MDRNTRDGITLVELVTAIAIIIVLAALMTPVIVKVKRGVRITESVSRLRQLHVALEIYRTDFGGTEAYSSFYSLGLPGYAYFEESLFGFNESFWASPCGPDVMIHSTGPTFVYGWISYVPPFYDPKNITENTNIDYKNYLVEYQQNAVVFVDPYCNEPGQNLRATLEVKRALAVLLSGQLVNKMKTGNAFYLQFYSDPVSQ